MGRGRGAPREQGWKHSLKSCPVVGWGWGWGGLAPFSRLGGWGSWVPQRRDEVKAKGLVGSIPLLPQGPHELGAVLLVPQLLAGSPEEG